MITIDASIAAKWIFSYEQNSDKAEKLLLKHSSAVTTIIVPDLLFLEIANTLATNSKLSLWKITNSLTHLYQMNLQTYQIQEKDLKNATRLARLYGTTIYDMIYAVVARKHKVELITADEKFASATKFKFVRLLKDLS